MNTKLSKLFAVSLMTSALFVSCSNDTEKVVESTPKTVSLSLNLPKMMQSKALGDKASTGNVVTVEGTVKVYALQSENGAILNTYTLDASDFFSPTGTAVQKTLEVNGTAQYMEFEGNIDNGTRTANVNTRQGIAKSSAVRVAGGAAIKAASGANATCEISVVPDMARVEVFGSFGETKNIQNLQINGIYLNNVKEDRTSTSLIKTTDNSTPDWTTAYAKNGVKSNLYTAFTTPVSGIADANGVAQADGYNFFPQGYTVVNGMTGVAETKEQAARYNPHIILNVSYTKDGVAVTDKWLNVVALKDGNVYFPTFDQGKIYQLNIADLTTIMDVVNPPVTDQPDPNSVSVDVTVTVADWTIVPVKPEV